MRRQGEGRISLARLMETLISSFLERFLFPTTLGSIFSPSRFTECKGYCHMILRTTKLCSSIEKNLQLPGIHLKTDTKVSATSFSNTVLWGLSPSCSSVFERSKAVLTEYFSGACLTLAMSQHP